MITRATFTRLTFILLTFTRLTLPRLTFTRLTINVYTVLICVAILSGCGKETPELTGVDLQAWKEDKHGCEGKRTAMTEAIRQQKNKLLGLDEMAIVKMLGKPDRNELYRRNQKFYRYFLQPSEACASPEKMPLQLIIRFNAMGLAKETMIE